MVACVNGGAGCGISLCVWFIRKEKRNRKKADEIIDDTEEIVLDESETKSEDTKDGFEK